MRRLSLALVLVASAACAEPGDTVYLDEEMNVTDLMKKAETAGKKKEWRTAIDALQEVVEKHPMAVVQAGPGLWLPAAVVCRRQIAQMPPEAITEYRDRFETTARQLSLPGTSEALRNVSIRYFCTAAGAEAMQTLGDRYADAGALEMAVRCWEEVADRHPDRAPRAAMLARLGYLYARLGHEEKLKKLVEKHGKLPVRARGDETTLAALLDGAVRTRRAAAPEALSVNADLSLTPLSEHSPVPRSVKWRVEIMKRPEKAPQKQQQPWRWNGESQVAQEVQAYPLVIGDLLVVNLGKGVCAFDIETGKLRWRNRLPEDISRFREYDSAPSEGFWLNRYYAVTDGSTVYVNSWEPGACRLRALDARSGKVLWGEGKNDGGRVADFSITGPPIVYRGRIYVGAVAKDRPNDTSLLAFDAATGAFLWSRFLASFEEAANRWGGQPPKAPAFAPVVAPGESFLYVCSNNGVFACIAYDGEMIWATKYPAVVGNRNLWWAQGRQETWDLSPVLVLGRDVLFFASDGSHCCRLNALTGLPWNNPDSSNPLVAMQVVAREESKHLVALEGDLATLTGAECKIYDVQKEVMARCPDEDNPARTRNMLALTRAYVGRGLATRDAIYVPMGVNRPEIWIYSRTFRLGDPHVRKIPWPGPNPPGTLFIAGNTLLSVSPYDITALSEEAPKEEPKPAVKRKVVAPEKKGRIARYVCDRTGKEWTQPAEEEKLCIDGCGGKDPGCGKLVGEEEGPPEDPEAEFPEPK